MKHPDLFDTHSTEVDSATVIAFPLARRAGKARRSAQVLLTKKSDRARSAYWQQVCDGLTAGLANVGLSDDEIARQLRTFSEAVSLEMQRQAHRSGREHA